MSRWPRNLYSCVQGGLYTAIISLMIAVRGLNAQRTGSSPIVPIPLEAPDTITKLPRRIFTSPGSLAHSMTPKPRDEYETTEAFATRSASLVPNADFILRIRAETFSYEADSQSVKIRVRYSDDGILTLEPTDDDTPSGLMYPRTAKPHGVRAADCDNPSCDGPWTWQFLGPIYMPMSPDSARAHMATLRLALIVHPTLGADFAAARTSFGFQSITADCAILLLYDRRSAQVLSRKKLQLDRSTPGLQCGTERLGR